MKTLADPLAPTLSHSPAASRARCQHAIPDDAPAGLCPRCALSAALARPPPLPPLHEIGEYCLEQSIARGGMGIVYRARHKTLGRTVALKMLVGGVWADDEDRVRFRAEAELAASLEHESIVPIYEVGEHDGQPYYAMRLMEESLSAHLERRGPLTPHQAAALVATVARAVHYGHRHGVVHRDLKPANLLLDAEGRPYVGDFGVSRRLEGRRHVHTATGASVGTPGYMAPEQAGAFGGDLTVAIDVWGLGAVLYELLCGRPPFTGASVAETIHHLLEKDPVPPRQLRPELERDLETACLKCLEKPPERRYASALDLALDLERVVRGEPIQARRQTRRERLARLWRRYPWRTGAVTGSAVFLIALAVGSTLAARAQEQELTEEVLHTNAWVARSVAGAVDLELGKLRQQIASLAANPHLRYAIEQGTPAAFPAPLSEPFDSLLFLDERGICRARWPGDPSFLGRDLSFRDYVGDTAKLAPGETMVSSAFYSKSDGSARFAVATPVFVGDRRAGVLAATLRSDSALGALSLTQEGPSARRSVRKVILLVRHGAEEDAVLTATDSAASARDNWMILVHPDLPTSGATADVDADALARLQRNRFDPEYRDALIGETPMLAGFAPVGDLPFSVVVETPEAYAVAPNARWTGRVASAGALAALFGILVCLGSFALSRRTAPAALAPRQDPL